MVLPPTTLNCSIVDDCDAQVAFDFRSLRCRFFPINRLQVFLNFSRFSASSSVSAATLIFTSDLRMKFHNLRARKSGAKKRTCSWLPKLECGRLVGQRVAQWRHSLRPEVFPLSDCITMGRFGYNLKSKSKSPGRDLLTLPNATSLTIDAMLSTYGRLLEPVIGSPLFEQEP